MATENEGKKLYLFYSCEKTSLFIQFKNWRKCMGLEIQLKLFVILKPKRIDRWREKLELFQAILYLANSPVHKCHREV